MALKTNSAESYYEYLEFSRHGDLKGDYVVRFKRDTTGFISLLRLKFLSFDSIIYRSGFIRALSSLDHNGLYRFLALT